MPEQALTIPWGVDVAAEVADVLGVGDLVYVGRVPRCVLPDILAQQTLRDPRSRADGVADAALAIGVLCTVSATQAAQWSSPSSHRANG